MAAPLPVGNAQGAFLAPQARLIASRVPIPEPDLIRFALAVLLTAFAAAPVFAQSPGPDRGYDILEDRRALDGPQTAPPSAPIWMDREGSPASPQTGAAAIEQARLEACLAKLDEQPFEGFEDALAWLAEGNRPPARACVAHGLIGLDRPAEAALRFEALAAAPDAGGSAQRAAYSLQAGNAWLLAGEARAALSAFEQADIFQPGALVVQSDKARAFAMLERWDEAETLLDAVLSHLPGDLDARRLRARARLAGGDLSGAAADVSEALAAEPADLDTLVLRGEVREAQRLAGLRADAPGN